MYSSLCIMPCLLRAAYGGVNFQVFLVCPAQAGLISVATGRPQS
jgi:hypothetical protein